MFEHIQVFYVFLLEVISHIAHSLEDNMFNIL